MAFSIKKAVAIAISGAAVAFAGVAIAQQEQFITVGTGGVTGVYYPAGGAICRLVNEVRQDTGIRCSAESTGGSVFNINAIRSGDLNFGVAQSDQQYNGYNGLGPFADVGPYEDLRFVFSIHAEPFTVVVRPDSGIETFEDLLGKRVNVGNPGSGQRATMELVMDRYGWTMDDFALASELPSREQAQALCDNQIDAFVFTVGHPSGSISEPVATCGARIINVDSDIIAQIVDDFPYYFWATIPAGMYNNTEDITTFGVGATFVTSADTPDDVVYTVVKQVFDNFDTFKGFHPAFAALTREGMANNGESAPIHPGALRYYQEVGLR
jgi:TRAP transporter TAXI family solute receptor